ncbi:MAG: mechanosensitive ion channel [Myxococcota bacterium]|nr:mechanosensitive ion channel [Myxococcota bacterium]
MLSEVLDHLRTPLFVLSGTPVSLLSILTAVLVLIVARVLAGVLARSLARTFESRGAGMGIGFAVSKITRWVGTIIGAVIALTTVGLNMTALVAAMTVLLVGIGFGLQKMAENFISGLILLIERPLRVGDFIEADECKGTIVDIGLRATKVETRDGMTYLIPNGDLITKPVTNYTTPSTRVRVWVPIGVAYGTDLARARATLLEVAAREPLALDDPAPEVRHMGFGDSSIDLALVVWIEHADDDDEVMSDLRFAIGDALTAAGIEIPFPQRDLHVKELPRSARAGESELAAMRR